jgi:hypothetical protein
MCIPLLPHSCYMPYSIQTGSEAHSASYPKGIGDDFAKSKAAET